MCGPNNQPLNVLGQAVVQLTYEGRSCKQPIYIIEGLKNNLLGLPAIIALQLLTKIDSIQPGNVQKSFPRLFQGLGTLKGDYQIQLKSDSKPYALYTARNVPIPLCVKVKQELTRMEKLGVISKVDKPTRWCAGMVVVPKKSGDVRIYVDLKPLNESVLRETHPLPGVYETLAQLTGATVMSKLDANSGFWQIPLSKDSCELTTFIAPFGRYCFNKLPFGISSAPTLHDELLLYGGRIVVPKQLQAETLQKIHTGHQGIVRCRLRATSSVWWPGISKDIEAFVQKCPECVKLAPNPREPLLTTPLPNHPWERVAADLFQLNGSTYLLVVDYFSRYPEVIQLTSTTSKSVISSLKSIFSRHGIPSVLMSDNGPQFDSSDMKEFANTYGFNHITSSPHYPQSNGLVERTVKTIKALLRHTNDPCLALLSYRSTPLPWCNFSPSELSMGRKVKTDIPQTANHFTPQWHFLPDFQRKENKFKEKQKKNYDRRHRVKPADTLPDDSLVWVTTGNNQTPGRVVSNAGTPRSYLVTTPSGLVRRNRQHLNQRLSRTDDYSLVTTSTTSAEPERDRIMTRTQTGADIRPPIRLTYD